MQATHRSSLLKWDQFCNVELNIVCAGLTSNIDDKEGSSCLMADEDCTSASVKAAVCCASCNLQVAELI